MCVRWRKSGRITRCGQDAWRWARDGVLLSASATASTPPVEPLAICQQQQHVHDGSSCSLWRHHSPLDLTLSECPLVTLHIFHHLLPLLQLRHVVERRKCGFPGTLCACALNHLNFRQTSRKSLACKKRRLKQQFHFAAFKLKRLKTTKLRKASLTLQIWLLNFHEQFCIRVSEGAYQKKAWQV